MTSEGRTMVVFAAILGIIVGVGIVSWIVWKILGMRQRYENSVERKNWKVVWVLAIVLAIFTLFAIWLVHLSYH